jgi:hypothetical protein
LEPHRVSLSAWKSALRLAGLAAVCLAGLACNLIGATPTPASAPTITPAAGGVPQVTVVWPPSGTEFVVRQEVTIYVSATDSVGITRLELRSANSVLSSVPSSESGGQTEFQAILAFTPTRAGQQDLEIIAYRRRVASDPVPISLVIRQRTADIVATALPYGYTAPPTQAGASCQVRINIGDLRYRTGPSTNYDIVGLFDLGEVVSVTGQNAQGTWFRASRNNQTIWFSASASYVTQVTPCAAAPVVQ